MDSSLEIKNNSAVPKEFVSQNLTVFEKILSELESISNVAKEILSQNGSTEIDLIINYKNKKARYSLKNSRKFDLKDFKALKSKDYVEKITF